MRYCSGSGFELLSDSAVTAVCHDFEDGQVIDRGNYRTRKTLGTQQLQPNRTITQNHYRNSIPYYSLRIKSVNLCLCSFIFDLLFSC